MSNHDPPFTAPILPQNTDLSSRVKHSAQHCRQHELCTEGGAVLACPLIGPIRLSLDLVPCRCPRCRLRERAQPSLSSVPIFLSHVSFVFSSLCDSTALPRWIGLSCPICLPYGNVSCGIEIKHQPPLHAVHQGKTAERTTKSNIGGENHPSIPYPSASFDTERTA